LFLAPMRFIRIFTAINHSIFGRGCQMVSAAPPCLHGECLKKKGERKGRRRGWQAMFSSILHPPEGPRVHRLLGSWISGFGSGRRPRG